MKKILFFLCGISIVASPTLFAASVLFSDVPENEWYAEAIYYLQEEGLVEGYSDGTYKPSASVNRAELAVMFNRLIDLENQREIDEQSCMNEFLLAESEGGEIRSGEISLGFSDDLTEDSITEILAIYKLSIDSIVPNYNLVSVKIAEGTEYEWVCLLRQNDQIETAEPAYLEILDTGE